jgi:uncharacterized protein
MNILSYLTKGKLHMIEAKHLKTERLPAALVQPAVALKARPFAMDRVRLLDGPMKDAMKLNGEYLQSLEQDRLLRSFRINAKLPAPGVPLGGWEEPNCEIRGHFAGHYLSALALMYAATGDDVYRTRGASMVAELLKCQQAMGGGYLCAFPEKEWDEWEAGTYKWAPWYVVQKMLSGLLDQHEYCGNAKALEMASAIASYFNNRLDRLSDEQIAEALATGKHRQTYGHETGSIVAAFWRLYLAAGDPASRTLALRLEKKPFLSKMDRQEDVLAGRHAVTHINEILGCAAKHEATGDVQQAAIVRFFWHCIVLSRTYATGSSTVNEMWPAPGKLAGTLGRDNQESCITYLMLQLTRRLFTVDPNGTYADFYEKALLNSVLGIQNLRGLPRYYTALATDSRIPESIEYACCAGTGIESFAKLNDSIYFHDDAGIWINLFVASTVEWAEKGVRLEQRTKFPAEGASTLKVAAAQPVEFELRIRVPGWASKGATVKINGTGVETTALPGSYLTLKRLWNDGDAVQISMPMDIRTEPMPEYPEWVAVLYGPVLLAGIFEKDTAGQSAQGSAATLPRVPSSNQVFVGDPTTPNTWLRADAGQPLTFHTVGQRDSMKFIPFNHVRKERYGIYWPVLRPGSESLDQMMDIVRTLGLAIDCIDVGDAVSEKAHDLQGKDTEAGRHLGRPWRHGNWFSYQLKVILDQPTSLYCVYWSADTGGRFDILVDGVKIGEQTLECSRPGKTFFGVTYSLPSEMTKGKNKITVTLQAHPAKKAGALFGIATLKNEQTRLKHESPTK